jgi:transcriptional regulator with XRE-family HTH domain
MTLREFMDSVPKGQKGQTIARIAKKAGVAPSAVRHWISGLRSPKLDYLPAIKEETGVSFKDLRPDAPEQIFSEAA